MITGRPILVKRLHKCEIFHAILGSRSFSGSSTGFTNEALTLDQSPSDKFLPVLLASTVRKFASFIKKPNFITKIGQNYGRQSSSDNLHNGFY